MDTKTHVTRTVSLPDRPRFVDLYQLLRHEWQAFPTLGQSQTHDLKFDDGSHRVWVSRMRPVDHETAEQEMAERVLYEHNDGGRWVALDRRGRRASHGPA